MQGSDRRWCDAIRLDEVEPKQHRHLTRAWLAQKEARWTEAAQEIDKARARPID